MLNTLAGCHPNVGFHFFWELATFTYICFCKATLHSLHERLQKIETEAKHYADPDNMIIFPFPFTYLDLPADRFHFEHSHFEYMGREIFLELWNVVQGLKHESFTRLYIQGTMGYGKSHILAVLAGLLYRSGKRVVYLPDCRALLRQPLDYLRASLLCAFADPSSYEKRETIRALGSTHDVEKFCCENLPMYFIIDQMNALDAEVSNQDVSTNSQKAFLLEFLTSLTVGHYQITSASANHKTALYVEKRQTNDLKQSLMGGMTEVCKYFTFYFVHHLISIL